MCLGLWMSLYLCICVCILQEMSPGEVTLEGLMEMNEEQVCELLQKFGANEEECARLNASLSCLRKAHQLGECPPKTDKDKLAHKSITAPFNLLKGKY